MGQSNRIIDEFAFIQQVTEEFQTYRDVIVPNGDDAAIYKPEDGKGQIVCVDTMIEHIHFKKETMQPFDIGYKSLAVNVSDIAAMGGEPTSFVISLAVTEQWTMSELKELYRGMKNLADEYHIDLLGGDTVYAQSQLVISVSAIGQIDEDIRLLRSNARAGDVIFLTGYIGDSAAGLDLLLHHPEEMKNEQYQTLIHAHQRPHPHVKQGQILASFSPSVRISLNDVSDGIASEAHEIAASSGETNLVLEKEKLPLSSALKHYAQSKQADPFHWALKGGEDFVLLGTVPQEHIKHVQASFHQEKYPFYRVGYVTEGNGQVYLKENQTLVPLNKQGYNHFSS